MGAKEEKKIERIQLEGFSYAIGMDGVTQILAIDRNGEMAAVRWFEVYRAGILTNEVNGKYVIDIYYEVNPEGIF